MNSFMNYGFRQAYDRFAKLEDPLAQINPSLDWGRYQPIAEELYDNKTEIGGHPNFPETIPDSTTIWLFRERLTENGKIDAIWQEIQRQLDAKGLIVNEGSFRMQHS